MTSCYADLVPQLVTRIDDETAAAIDALVDAGDFAFGPTSFALVCSG